MTALLLAALQGRSPRVVSLLLDRGADPAMRNARGETALVLAANNPAMSESEALTALAGAAH